ncbi:MAG: PKD domain-containing protein, partial [Rhodothermaceae bacterium]|nr:PKD domain-containing protein [Rhodothermaceae bacterium]
LWEVTWDMIDAHGFDADLYNAGGTAGNQIMLNLVTEGMKLQPCSPGFVDGRDAILAADAALYGGANTDMLWAAFARRGLGLSASQGSVFTNSDNTEAFDVPTTGGNTPPDASFTFSCTALDCTFTDTSSDSDGTIASRAWTFGDGGTSSATNPAHTYAADGTYTVGLTVTDDDGDSDTASQSVTVTSGGGGDPIALSGVARNNGRKWFADLTWTPSDGGRLDVYLDGAVVKTTRDDGFFSYNLGRNASGSYDFQVCEQDSGDCSNVATVNVDGVMAADGPASSLGAGEETPETTLLGAYPNPFNGSTRIGFSLAERAEVSLEVYNSLGQRVAVLASGTLEAGPHQTIFDASALPSGVYLYRLHTGETVETGRLMLVR